MSTRIPFYVTNYGLLVQLEVSRSEKYRINDKPLAATFHPRWWTVEGETELKSYSIHAGTRPINERYVLLNETVAGLESMIRREEIERDEDGCWAGKHLGLDPLYKYEKDDEDLGFVEHPFTAVPLGNVTLERLGDPTNFSYKLHSVRDGNKADNLAYKDIFQQYSWMEPRIGVDDIAKASTPDVAWHLYPCSVNSQVAYRIIRAHVKDNIDPRFAEVTSDYDFCFTVKKKIRVVPFINKWETKKVNGRSYHPPRFKSQNVEYEKREVFEMTNAKDRYNGYTVVEGFEGGCLEEMAANIDRYLSDLMEVINAPLTKCPSCEGRAVTDFFKLPTNERKKFRLAEA